MVVKGAFGIHGLDVAGMHGIGVSTPSAAAVAAATVGLAGDEHMPNVEMFTIGAVSWIVSAGRPSIATGTPFGIAVSGAGDTPKLHCAIAPVTQFGAPISGLPTSASS